MYFSEVRLPFSLCLLRVYDVFDPNPLGGRRLSDLYSLGSDFRLDRLPFEWRGNRVFENRYGDLPTRP